MATKELLSVESDSLRVENTEKSFSSAEWLLYFQNNKESRISLKFRNDSSVPLSVRVPLIRSLQRFQVGESGEGKHLLKYARRTNDPNYIECIDLFIKEEQYHALVLAQMIQSMDGALLTWHWSDIAFIGLRRMLGLKTELLILLIAEIIGKCFYAACANSLANSQFRDAFSLIVLDEIGHLEFHCNFLCDEFKVFPAVVLRVCYFLWSVLFLASCFVFISDHRHALKALKVRPRDFLEDCAKTFQRTARRVGLTKQYQV